VVRQGVNVDVFSDVVCPWCYLGRARFGAAAERFGGPVEVTWLPYQLDPQATGGGLTSVGLAERFGGAERVEQMHAQMRELMAAEGLPYEPDIAISANTRDAHRVIDLAGTAGVQDAVVGRLFRAYHAEGRDLNDHATLTELAGDGGLDPAQVSAMLSSDTGDAAVAAKLESARTIGVTGVPFYVFDEKWAVSGAQTTEYFESALREVTGR
jgi:predicted DsbA family dithiol-disulfide isomerase